MADKAIKFIHDQINLALGKEQTAYFSPEKIDDAIHSESLNLFKKFYDQFEATQKITDYLAPFMRFETNLAVDPNGFIEKPDDLFHVTAVMDDNEKEIRIVDRAAWASRVNDPLFGPEDDYPICRVDRLRIRFRPKDIGLVELHYLKLPVKPVYAYTITGDRYVYNNASSVDIEWDEPLHDEIINRVLANLGIATRESDIVEYSQIEKQQEGL